MAKRFLIDPYHVPGNVLEHGLAAWEKPSLSYYPVAAILDLAEGSGHAVEAQAAREYLMKELDKLNLGKNKVSLGDLEIAAVDLE